VGVSDAGTSQGTLSKVYDFLCLKVREAEKGRLGNPKRQGPLKGDTFTTHWPAEEEGRKPMVVTAGR